MGPSGRSSPHCLLAALSLSLSLSHTLAEAAGPRKSLSSPGDLILMNPGVLCTALFSEGGGPGWWRAERRPHDLHSAWPCTGWHHCTLALRPSSPYHGALCGVFSAPSSVAFRGHEGITDSLCPPLPGLPASLPDAAPWKPGQGGGPPPGSRNQPPGTPC